MTVSDESILLASSPIVGYVSLEYFIYSGLTGIKDGNKNMSIPSMRETWKRLLDANIESFRAEALDKIPLDSTFDLINRQESINNKRRDFIERNIIKAYVSKFNLDPTLLDGFKGLERKNLSDKLYMAHLKGQFKGTPAEGLVREIEDSMLIPSVSGEITISQYVDEASEKLTRTLISYIVDMAVTHRKECILKSPGFKIVLANSDLNAYRESAGVNAGGEDDVIENINFAVLARIQNEFSGQLQDTFSIDSAMAAISILQDFVVNVCSQELVVSGGYLKKSGYTGDISDGMNPVYIDLTPANAKNILNRAFPFCDVVAYTNSYIPDEIFERFYEHPRYSKPAIPVDPANDFLPHFWLVFLKYYAVTDNNLGGSFKKVPYSTKDLEQLIIKVVSSFANQGEYVPLSDDQTKKIRLYNSRKIIMYTLKGCPYCADARSIIRNVLKKPLEEKVLNSLKDPAFDEYRGKREKETVPFFVVQHNAGPDSYVNTFSDLKRIVDTPIIRPPLRKRVVV